jgi:hypothetical protein
MYSPLYGKLVLGKFWYINSQQLLLQWHQTIETKRTRTWSLSLWQQTFAALVDYYVAATSKAVVNLLAWSQTLSS